MTQPTQTTEIRPVRQIPSWISILIILLAIGGGSWMLWNYWTNIRSASAEWYEPLSRDPAEHIDVVNANHWSLRFDNGSLDITRSRDAKGASELHYNIGLRDARGGTPRGWQAATNAEWEVVNNPRKYQQRLNLTKAQIDQLDKWKASIGHAQQLTDDQIRRMNAVFVPWLKLFDEAQQAAAAHARDASDKVVAWHAAQGPVCDAYKAIIEEKTVQVGDFNKQDFSKLLTVEQLKTFEDMRAEEIQLAKERRERRRRH